MTENQTGSLFALVSRQGESSWVSCQSITRNLISAYKSLFHDIKLIPFPKVVNDFTCRTFAEELNRSGIQKIIFVDHQPCPADLIKYLNPEIEMVAHLFGDFMLQLSSWQQIERSHYRIHFITASERQAKLVKQFFFNDQKVSVIPFALEEDFFPREEEFNEQDRPYQFIYAGRLNYQKNILELIEAFLIFKKAFHENAVLKIVGMPDILGIPYLGREILPGTFAHQFNQLLEKLNDPHDVQYLGILTRSELRSLYLESDCFISMSAYNDEDYGMAVAEALACGLPCLLSDWGGYAGFKSHFPEDVKTISLDKNLKPQASVLAKKIFQFASTPYSLEKRRKLSQLVKETLSVEATAGKIDSLTSVAEFEGWNDLLDQVVGYFAMMPGSPFSGGDGNYSNLYHKLYACYRGEE